MLVWILIFTFIGSFVSLLGGILLLWKEGLVKERTHFLIAFAAGSLLTAAFFDLLPEALDKGESGGILGITFLGIIVFFFLERFLIWYHHHSCPEGEDCSAEAPTVFLLNVGDTLHNFLDGVIIAGTFLVDVPLGVITSLAVFFHEIPQEIGNFGVFLSLGMERRRVLLINILSALFAFAGAILAFYFLKSFENLIPYLVAFAAGNFIYIAASDLIPELHQTFKKEIAFSQTLAFLAGILVILITIRVFE